MELLMLRLSLHNKVHFTHFLAIVIVIKQVFEAMRQEFFRNYIFVYCTDYIFP